MNFDYKNDVQPLIVKYDPIKKSTFNLKNIVASKAGLIKRVKGSFNYLIASRKIHLYSMLPIFEHVLQNRRSDDATDQIVSQKTEENPPVDIVQYKLDLEPENKKTESALIIEVQNR